jgi:integration host factor subunit alpha
MNLSREEYEVSDTVTRAMLCAAATRRTGLDSADVAAVCERMFALMGEALMEGQNVKLTAFASLQVRSRAERLGRNPRTGEEHKIAPRQTVALTPSVQLRDKLSVGKASAAKKSAGKIGERV